MKITKVRDVKTPLRANNTDAGIDFFVPNDSKPFSGGAFSLYENVRCIMQGCH